MKAVRVISSCRSCGSGNLTFVLDLGEQYLSDFRDDDSKPPKYPLRAVLCEDCKLVQLRHTAPSSEMYHENYGFKSGISDSIKADLKEIVQLGLDWIPAPMNWLDIASNDGTLLSYVPKPIWRVGVDPVKFLCDEATQHAEKIVNKFFDAEDFLMDKFDVVTSISCFYDMDDPNKFVGDVAKVLDELGIWIIQQNYLLPTLRLNAIDNFCHEHLEYYTLKSLEPLLERHDLEVIDLSTNMVNGGSLRTVVARKGAFMKSTAVFEQREIEAKYRLGDVKTYTDFAERAKNNLAELKALVDDLNADGNKIYILAASTRGSTIWQAAGIDERDVDYAVERNPAKVGKYFSAIGIPIISEEEARKLEPDFMIVGPWFFADEIIKREHQFLEDGGSLIVPLPGLRVISG